jgi:hypothetical protein
LNKEASPLITVGDRPRFPIYHFSILPPFSILSAPSAASPSTTHFPPLCWFTRIWQWRLCSRHPHQHQKLLLQAPFSTPLLLYPHLAVAAVFASPSPASKASASSTFSFNGASMMTTLGRFPPIESQAPRLILDCTEAVPPLDDGLLFCAVCRAPVPNVGAMSNLFCLDHSGDGKSWLDGGWRRGDFSQVG